MKDSTSSERPYLSVVIPVVERYGDLERLLAEYGEQARRIGRETEFVFVVDYRQREVLPQLKQLQATVDEKVCLVLLGGTFGESASLTVGLEQARGEIIATVASYFQVDPAGLVEAVQQVEDGYDLIVGRRFPRTDPFFNRLQTRVFHSIVRWMTKSGFGDISCGFRVMSREVAEELEIYGGLHRFIPILAKRLGFRILELPLAQRREDTTTRYYGTPVYLKRLLDILTVFFLVKFTRRPLRFFGMVGLLTSLVGGIITAYLGFYRILGFGPIGDRPLLLLGVLLFVLGIQTLSIGLIGEIIIFTHARKVRDYRIAETIHYSRMEGAGSPEPDWEPENRTV